jgi:hypothetical protein
MSGCRARWMFALRKGQCPVPGVVVRLYLRRHIHEAVAADTDVAGVRVDVWTLCVMSIVVEASSADAPDNRPLSDRVVGRPYYLKPGSGRLRCSRRRCFVCFSYVVNALPDRAFAASPRATAFSLLFLELDGYRVNAAQLESTQQMSWPAAAQTGTASDNRSARKNAALSASVRRDGPSGGIVSQATGRCGRADGTCAVSG